MHDTSREPFLLFRIVMVNKKNLFSSTVLNSCIFDFCLLVCNNCRLELLLISPLEYKHKVHYLLVKILLSYKVNVQ